MTQASPAQRFELLVPVFPADVDELGHVNNTVYLRWVQDVATAHWQALASAESQAEVAWVVLRHEIDYKAPALPGDEVLLRTWVGEAARIRFERHTEIPCGAQTIARASAHTLVPDQHEDRQAAPRERRAARAVFDLARAPAAVAKIAADVRCSAMLHRVPPRRASRGIPGLC